MIPFAPNRFIVVWIFSALLCTSTAYSQGTRERQTQPPIANSEFYGIKTQSRITQRFEIYDPHSLADLKAVKAMGFDQVILDQPQWHVEATALGLDVVLANWWTKDSSKELIEQTFRIAKQVDPKHLVGISVMDEPERNAPGTPFQFYVDLYQSLKNRLVEGLAGVKLEISYWGPLSKWDQEYYDYFSNLYVSADVMRIMPYPDLQEGPLSEVYLMLQRSKRAMRQAEVEIPHVVILQAWVLPPDEKLPTIDELRVMAYQAMLAGAGTLSFFEYKPEVWQKTKNFTEGFQELMLELRSLRQRLNGASIESTLLENGVLEATVHWPTGRTDAIRINTNRFDQDDLKGLEIRDSSLFSQQLAEVVPDEKHRSLLPNAMDQCSASCIPCITPSCSQLTCSSTQEARQFVPSTIPVPSCHPCPILICGTKITTAPTRGTEKSESLCRPRFLYRIRR